MKAKIYNPEILLLFIIALIEGAALMASEVIAAELIAPFFGTSIYSWTAMLIITLGGIAIGYWLGGILATYTNIKMIISLLLFTASLLFFIMPAWSILIMNQLVSKFNIIGGALFSQFFFLFPLMINFGIISPLITQQFSLLKNNVLGQSVSIIWGLSTTGGILGVLFTGIYAIPHFGIETSCNLFALPLFSLFILYIVSINKKKLKIVK